MPSSQAHPPTPGAQLKSPVPTPHFQSALQRLVGITDSIYQVFKGNPRGAGSNSCSSPGSKPHPRLSLVQRKRARAGSAPVMRFIAPTSTGHSLDGTTGPARATITSAAEQPTTSAAQPITTTVKQPATPAVKQPAIPTVEQPTSTPVEQLQSSLVAERSEESQAGGPAHHATPVAPAQRLPVHYPVQHTDVAPFHQQPAPAQRLPAYYPVQHTPVAPFHQQPPPVRSQAPKPLVASFDVPPLVPAHQRSSATLSQQAAAPPMIKQLPVAPAQQAPVMPAHQRTAAAAHQAPAQQARLQQQQQPAQQFTVAPAVPTQQPPVAVAHQPTVAAAAHRSPMTPTQQDPVAPFQHSPVAPFYQQQPQAPYPVPHPLVIPSGRVPWATRAPVQPQQQGGPKRGLFGRKRNAVWCEGFGAAAYAPPYPAAAAGAAIDGDVVDESESF